MKNIYKFLSGLFFLIISYTASFGAALTWVGTGAGGAGTNFNAAANWSPAAVPTAADDLTINMTTSGTILVTSNITANSITMTISGSNVVGVLDIQTFTLTLNAASSFNSTAGNMNTRGILHAGTAPGKVIFNGDANFNVSGSELFKFRAAVTNPGQLVFMLNVTTGTNAFTEPGDEPQFAFNRAGTQNWTFNSTSNYVVPESIIIGQGNTSITSFIGAGSAGLLGVYNGFLTVSAGCTLDIGKFSTHKLSGTGAVTLAANSLLRIGATNDFPTGFSVYSIDITNTVEFYGPSSTQNVGAMPGVDNYGNLLLTGGGLKQQTSLGGILVRGTLTINAATTYYAWNEITTVNGTMTNNGTYDASDDIQTFNGNFVNNGTWVQSTTATSVAVFSGAAAQTLSGTTLTTAFQRMTVNNTSATGVTLSTPIAVIAVLTLTDGYVFTDAVNLLTLRDNCTSSAGSVASFVDGPMRKIGNDVFVFPLGDNIYWARIGITAPALATDAFTAQYFATAYATLTPVSAPNAYVSVVEHWILDRTTGTSNVSPTLYWESGTRSGINTFTSDLHVARWDGSAWQDHGSGTMTGSAAAGSITTGAAVTAFSPFTFASITASTAINPLPIELLSFEAHLNVNQVDLKWATSSETNNDFYTIEKSRDGQSFEFVTQVDGAGNSTSYIEYFDIDRSPYQGVSYYRLKQTDFNGKFSYSSIVPVEYNTNTESDISIFPNPGEVGSSSYIIFNEFQGEEVLVVVRDIAGKELYAKIIVVAFDNEISAIDTEGKLAKGTYLITASSKNKLYSKKLIIK
ncbi:MAG: T9SS type A sorting domain-containing protein [Bacteroidota bacterium]|nr:T9SS type A sorting domain-containing protein [Bacteroidota bacterium]